MTKLEIAIGSLVFALLLFLCVDCLGGRVRYFECDVVDHHYVPAYTQVHTSVDDHGNVTTWTTYNSEEYQLGCAQIGAAGYFWVNVPRYSWDTMTNGEYVTVRTRQGRWTKHQWLPTIAK